MSSNLLKRNITNIQKDDVRLIAVNDLVDERLEAIGLNIQILNSDKFVSDIVARQMEGGDSAETTGEFVPGNIIKANANVEVECEAARSEAEKILVQAREQAAQIEQEARIVQEMIDMRMKGYVKDPAEDVIRNAIEDAQVEIIRRVFREDGGQNC